MSTQIKFTRINNDTNGNPRYVCHFLNLLTDIESNNYDINLSEKYNMALQRAKKIGGKKFHNKQYGGGIVFQSYNISETEKDIQNLLK
jgi:hypothetical protein